jgi:hypothetical protein
MPELGAPVTDTQRFALIVLLVAAVGLVAVLSNRLTERVKVPSPAIVLVGAAIAVELFPALHAPPWQAVERVVTIALVCILLHKADISSYLAERLLRESAVMLLHTDRLLLRPWRAGEAAVQRELWTERDPRVPPRRRIDADGHPTVRELEEYRCRSSGSAAGHR